MAEVLSLVLARVYRGVSRIAWASLGSSPSRANGLVRLGYLARQWLRLAPSHEAVGTVRGSRMWFHPGSDCYWEMTHGNYEAGATRLLESILVPGMVVVDVGAHIGYFSLLAARLVGAAGKVYAFEPAPANFRLLTKNVDLNGLRNIIAVNKAVSDRVGESILFLQPGTLGHSLFPETLGKGETSIKVESITLDRFFADENWPHVDLVKIDAEGAEPAVVNGMAELLKRNPSIKLVFEYIPMLLNRVGQDHQELLIKLEASGFRLWNITDGEGLSHLQCLPPLDSTWGATLYAERTHWNEQV